MMYMIDLLTLNEPPERNWTGTEKNYESFKQFLAYLNTYREEYILTKNKTRRKSSKEDMPPEPCTPPTELVWSEDDLADKESSTPGVSKSNKKKYVSKKS